MLEVTYTCIDSFNFCNRFGPSTKKSRSENIFQFFYLFVRDIVFVQIRRAFFGPDFMFGYNMGLNGSVYIVLDYLSS